VSCHARPCALLSLRHDFDSCPNLGTIGQIEKSPTVCPGHTARKWHEQNCWTLEPCTPIPPLCRGPAVSKGHSEGDRGTRSPSYHVEQCSQTGATVGVVAGPALVVRQAGRDQLGQPGHRLGAHIQAGPTANVQPVP
jgi:hypothetical protein